MKKELFAALIPIVVLSSCTVMGSLNSLSEDEKQFVFKKELIGNWSDPNNLREWFRVDTMPGSHGKLYMMEQFSRSSEESNKVDTLCFLGRLVQLGDGLFLDCKVDCDKMFAVSKSMTDLVLAKHLIIKTSFNSRDKIVLAAPDPDELMKLIKAGKVNLKYMEVKKDDYLILNNSRELQTATQALNKYPQVYKNKTELSRSS